MLNELFHKWFHPGPTLERDMKVLVRQLKNDELGYKQVFEKALKDVQLLNEIHEV